MTYRIIRAVLGAIVAFCMLLPGAARADGQGPVMLTVAGAIGADGAARAFDEAALRDVAWQAVTTHTSFTEGPQDFAGVPLAALLEAVGAEGATLRATALNDYSVEFPAELAAAHDVLLAIEHNGTRMSVRDKGPIWIVFPLSPEEASERLFDREMVWQLARIDVLP